MKLKILTYTGIFWIKLVSKLPFPALYFLSDILFFFVYHLFHYRKFVVLQNLRNSFPEKSEIEISKISNKFYHHLCDLTLESIKVTGMKKTDFLKRMVITNPEIINQYFEKGRSVVILTMHYNNWEWSNSFPFYLKHRILGVYKPLQNPIFDKFMNKSREKPGNELV